MHNSMCLKSTRLLSPTQGYLTHKVYIICLILRSYCKRPILTESDPNPPSTIEDFYTLNEWGGVHELTTLTSHTIISQYPTTNQFSSVSFPCHTHTLSSIQFQISSHHSKIPPWSCIFPTRKIIYSSHRHFRPVQAF